MKNKKKVRIRTELIEEFINKSNISLDKFCKISRVERFVINQMQENDFDFDIRYLFRVCKIIGLELKDFFEDIK